MKSILGIDGTATQMLAGPSRPRSELHLHSRRHQRPRVCVKSASFLALWGFIKALPVHASPLSAIAQATPSSQCARGTREGCPFIVSDIPKSSLPDLRKRASESLPPLPHTVVPVSKVPYKYEQGDDGRWRRAESFTLYGSTICPGCTPNPVVQELNDLPKGWAPATRRRTYGQNATVIVASIALAVFIYALIIGCISWRRKRHNPDPECHRTSKGHQVESQENLRHSKQKAWVRVPSRWRLHGRVRSRKKRRSAPSFAEQAVPATSLQDALTAGSSSLTLSTSLSSAASVCSANSTTGSSSERRPSHPNPDTRDMVDEMDNTLDSIVVHDKPLPPAYDHNSRMMSNFLTDVRPPLSDCQFCAAQGDLNLPSSSPGIDHEVMCACEAGRGDCKPYIPSSAHVAIDDKATLARMAELASAPSAIAEQMSGTEHGMAPLACVPVWRDEDPRDFENEEGDKGSPIGSVPPPPLPPWPWPPPPPLSLALPKKCDLDLESCPSSRPLLPSSSLAPVHDGLHAYTCCSDVVDLDVLLLMGESPSAPPLEAAGASSSSPLMGGPSAPPLEMLSCEAPATAWEPRDGGPDSDDKAPSRSEATVEDIDRDPTAGSGHSEEHTEDVG